LWADGTEKPEFTGVNEDFEYRPTANGSCAVDLEQVLIPNLHPFLADYTVQEWTKAKF
jgi:hypothetical protein